MLNREEIEKLKERGDEEHESLEQRRQKTREAYKSKEARCQLTRILVNAKLFSQIHTQEEMATRNFALSILEDMGFLDWQNIPEVIDFLFTLPIVGEDGGIL